MDCLEMTAETNLVPIAHNEYEHVLAGSARWRHGKGRYNGLLIVSACLPDGRRVDIDSSACGFMCQGVMESINGAKLAAKV